MVPFHSSASSTGTEDEGPREPLPEPGAEAASTSFTSLSSTLVGTLLLDRFRVLEPLGEGGMAVVFLAEHVTIHKKFAIKVLLPEHAGKPDLVERFLQEARAASMIGHENVVEITDYGQAPNGSVFIVMELLAGQDLATALERDVRMPWSRARPILLQICRALAAAHSKGVVHRDLKPENVFLTRRHGSSDFVKVLDFGIAKILGDLGGGRSLTKTGAVFGTPQYMSPEQAEGLEIDHRADIYSLGVIMYELMTGRVPFEANTYAALVTMHLYDPPPAPSEVAPEAEISAEVEALILKALQKDRELRFQNMGELSRAIEAVGTGAAPVEVVAEARARPQTRGQATSYSGSRARRVEAGPRGRSSPATAPIDRRVLVFGAVGLIGLVVAIVTGTILIASRGEDPPDPAQEEVTRAAPEASGEPPPPQPPPPAKDAPVSIVLTSNVDAQILDAASEAILGRTNDPAGLTLDRSDVPRQLLLRAEGYEDLPLELVPRQDIAANYELIALERGKKKKKRAKKKKKKREGDPLSLLPIETK